MQQFAIEFEEQVKAGKSLDGSRMTVEQFAELWLKDGQAGLEENTKWKHEHYLVKHILPAISERLGHSKTSTTMDIYAHALKKADREAADNLANYLKSQKNKAN